MKIQLSDHFTYGRLILFTLPSVAMMVFTSVYGVVDGFFVSNYVGKTQFASINLIIPFLMILGAVGFMIGAGGSALTAKTFGEGDARKANRIFSLLVYIIIGTGAVFTLLGQLLLEPVSRFLGASEDMLPNCIAYGRIILLSLVPFMLQNVFQSFLITAGKPTMGLVVTISAGVSNMLLDWLFMAVFGWGITGAAAATAIAQGVGGFVPLIYFIVPNKSSLRLCRTSIDRRVILKACTNGSSEFMTNISMSIVSMVYNFQLMNIAGEDGVSAYGIIMYINFIFIAIFIGFSIGSAPIVGFHYGAGDTDELKNLFGKSVVIIGTLGAFLTVSAELAARPLAMIFVGYDADLLEMTVQGLMICSLSFILCGFSIFGSGFFTALNNGLVSAVISFCRTLVFEIIAVLVLPLFFGIIGIWSAVVATEVLSVALTVFFFVCNRKKYGYA